MMRCLPCLSLVLLLAGTAVAQVPEYTPQEKFAMRLETIIADRDAKALMSTLDRDGFVHRTLEGMGNYDLAVLDKWARKDVAEFGESLFRRMPREATLTFLHARRVGDTDLITFRMLSDKGINYWRFEISPGESDPNKMRFCDLYTAISGESFAEMFRSIYSSSPPKNRKPTTGEMVEDKLYQTFSASMRGTDPRAMINAFDALPERFKRDKAAQLSRLRAAMLLEGDDLTRALDDFKQRFGDNPACDLLMLDFYAERKQHDKVHAALDRIEKAIGGDAFLQVMHANYYVLEKRLFNAEDAAKKAIEIAPFMVEGYQVLLTIAQMRRDFDAMQNLMLVMELEPNWQIRFEDDLGETEFFAEFRKSPQYKQWLTKRPK
jgi:hypothetical protein